MRAVPVQTGFTLIELLVTLTIAAILLAIGVPAFNSSIASARASDGANSLLAALELARSEAMRRGVTVSVCRVTAVPATACINAAGGSFVAADWAAGWMIFADTAVGGTVGVFDAGPPADEVVTFQQQFAPGAATRVEIVETKGVGIATYRPDGLRVGAELVFRVAYPQAAQGAGQSCRQVTVNATGQAAIARINC
ncbi:MAG: GspH/FimT family pseudopilin [Burkholderiales bacterium]|jgi:type IV fimbrial biogenesis protein FimT|nr:GspH/FimT family pseudopilin [Burkholderiales bacterium]